MPTLGVAVDFANGPAFGIELLEDVAGAEVVLAIPEQGEHHLALAAQAHAQVAATQKGVINATGARRGRAGRQGWGSHRDGPIRPCPVVNGHACLE